MEFRLHYKGPLKSKGRREEKQALRLYFHPQLRELWGHSPLRELIYPLNVPEEDLLSKMDRDGRIHRFSGYRFVPLVTKSAELLTDLHITLLRPEVPGFLVKDGDIDNRLKTLFDSLRIPKGTSELPLGYAATQDTDPLYCLLEDDALVTGVSVITDRMLAIDPAAKDDVILLIHVKVKASRVTMDNMSLVG